MTKPSTISTYAENADGILYRVPSRSKPEETHLVDLGAYKGSGSCTCVHFQCRLEPILRKLVSPSEAIERGLVKLSKGQDPQDALRCAHILSARRQFTDDVLKAIAEKESAQKGF